MRLLLKIGDKKQPSNESHFAELNLSGDLSRAKVLGLGGHPKSPHK